MSATDILLVDDEPDILDIGLTVLRGAGYHVLPALNGDIALILLEQGLPFRLLVTDIIMPGLLDGFSLARKARETLPDIRIVYTTGYSGAASIRSRGAPYGDTLVKPWMPRDLLEIVNNTMAKAE
ncbi:MAG: hybrid sensor histidine kinase/response regulator [Rhodospirillales bacterium]|jgi:CheY-like chemotaxis protein|nr:hybrid sensor histidine kinase/response regulator [Rhodospirillales bacterium]